MISTLISQVVTLSAGIHCAVYVLFIEILFSRVFSQDEQMFFFFFFKYVIQFRIVRTVMECIALAAQICTLHILYIS